jgi:DNA-binding NarL/FixJ family response regulator
MSAAALLCDHQDRIWHMHTPEETLQRVKDGALMHVAPSDGVQLIQAPIMPWGAYFPALRALALTSMQAVQEQLRRVAAIDEPQCRQVWERLSPRQRDVLRTFARGMRPDEVATHLNITLNTVNTHKTAILSECRVAWNLPDNAPLDNRYMRAQWRRGAALDEPQCRQVWERLSPRQRDVLRAFARGMRPDEVATHLNITLNTVNTHKTAILSECRVAWNLPDDAPLDYRSLRERFAGFLERV